MPIRIDIPAFSGGEIAPSLHSRVDLSKYGTALKTAKNFIIHRHGSASNRPGTEFIAEVKDSTKKVRLVPFEYSTEQAYILEFGNYYIRFYKDEGQIAISSPDAWSGSTAYVVDDYVVEGGTNYRCILAHTNQQPPNATYWVAQDIYEITTPYTEADLPELKFAQSADVLYIVHPDHAPQELSRMDHDDWTLTDYAFENGPFMLSNIDEDNRMILGILWDASTEYVEGNYVVNDNIIYRCLATTTNNEPPNVTYWNPIDSADQGDVEVGHTGDVAEYRLFAEKDTFNADMVGALIRLRTNRPGQTVEASFNANQTYWSGFKYSYHDLGDYELWIGKYAREVKIYTIWNNSTTYNVGDVVLMAQVFHGPAYVCNVSNSNTSPLSGQNTSLETDTLYCKEGNTWRIQTKGTWVGEIAIMKSYDNGLHWQLERKFAGDNYYNANTFGIIDSEALLKVVCTQYTSGTIEVSLSVDPFEIEGIVEISEYVDAKTVKVDSLNTCPISSYIDDWAEGSWSDYRGWPSAITLYQDRLAFAKTVTEPQTEWLTKSGNYTDFGRSTPLVDSDGITINLTSKAVNGINNLIALSKILTLTTSSEWSTGNQDSPITPTSVSIKNEGSWGSSLVDPIIIGNRILFVQRQGTTIRDIGYEFSSDGFVGGDISILASHLFEGLSVVAMAYQKEPDSIAWVAMDDGSWLSLTYMREQEVFAWSHHETEGDVEDVAVISGTTYDELWMVVNRASGRYIELMKNRMESTDMVDQWFVDSGLTWNNPLTITGATQASPVVVTSVAHGLSNGDLVDITEVLGMTELNGNRYKVAAKTDDTISLTDPDDDSNIDGTAFTAYTSAGVLREAILSVSGLDHLEGETVSILADGKVIAQQAVASGAITLTDEAGIIIVGLPYTSDLETLKLNINTREGVTVAQKLHVPSVTISFYRSAGLGSVGPDADNLDPVPIDPANTPGTLYTGDITPTLAANYGEDGHILYRQEDPLPVTILAFIPEVNIGGVVGNI
jgi:hypothetical protein